MNPILYVLPHTYLVRPERHRRAFVRRLQRLRDALRRVGTFGPREMKEMGEMRDR